MGSGGLFRLFGPLGACRWGPGCLPLLCLGRALQGPAGLGSLGALRGSCNSQAPLGLWAFCGPVRA